MEFLHTVLLAFTQAATEFLPVSSSGHLLLLKGIFNEEEIPIIFDVLVHVGSLAAVLVFFSSRIQSTCVGAVNELRGRSGESGHVRFFLYVILSTMVTFTFYLLFKDPIEAGFRTPSVLPKTYLFTTLLIGVTFFSKRESGIPIHNAVWYIPLIIGLFQGLAIFPGVSRSGSTIAIMLLLGIKREDAAYFSFFLFIPAILGALVLQLGDIENKAFVTQNAGILALAFLLSAGFSYLFLSFLTFVIKRGKLWVFSIYTLTLVFISIILF